MADARTSICRKCYLCSVILHFSSFFRQLFYPILWRQSNLQSNAVLLLVKVTAITTKLNEVCFFIYIFFCILLPLSSFLLLCVLLVYGSYHTQTEKCIKRFQLNGIVKSYEGMHTGRLPTSPEQMRLQYHLISIHTNNTSITPMDTQMQMNKSNINKFLLHFYLARPESFITFRYFLPTICMVRTELTNFIFYISFASKSFKLI